MSRSPIVQKEHALPHAPQGRRAEFVSARGALRHLVGQRRAHVLRTEVENRLRSAGWGIKFKTKAGVSMDRLVAHGAVGLRKHSLPVVWDRLGERRFAGYPAWKAWAAREIS